MVRSDATTVDAYLDELPEKRRREIARVREMILARLPAGYRESMNFGMISYEIPLERYPATYNGKPLGYIALAAQKNYNALYLMGVYGDGVQEVRLRKAFDNAGKKLDMGKSCVRFKEADDLALDVIGDLIASMPPEAFIEMYEASRAR